LTMKKQDALVRLHDDKYYIHASSSYADDRVCILNYEDTFGVFDRWGDIKQIGSGAQGIYHQGTRFLSDMELEINNYRPLLLSSNVKTENEILSVDLTNPDMDTEEGVIPKGNIHIARSKFLQNGSLHELIILTNYGVEPYTFEMSFSFHGDFRDIFEVRGLQTQKTRQNSTTRSDRQRHGEICLHRPRQYSTGDSPAVLIPCLIRCSRIRQLIN